ncbi:Y_Y_Y domain-containing protein [Bernardetia litoralis DSM 6794]|uniref:Y_Y_Y domain-containing protein n=1 Tax=Bernardetia litoralis (strain ATCC 23117 / DSM 6794 / NBRC 15988 / NCIMB 1366 / Fx l1 / Sio-4) TaxID=880071 RepID=I4AMB1_BERLS|nr:SpoIIE family protein phosphatase [Bernardetia litoralis]AFM05096.1 Y_Y_Y domain-containing protein [Bernardetia litoralis DSM 6794]
MRIIFTFLISLFFVSADLHAQAIPTTEHYTIYDYHAHPQNWSVVQDDIGRIYVANTKGVLEYDGNTWKLIELPNLASVTALTKGKDGKIYIGAASEIGYLDSDSVGNKVYVSLLDKMSEQDKKFSTIWKVFSTSDGIVFQSFEKIFWYKNEQFKTISPNSAFHLAFQTKEKENSKLFVREWGKGLHHLTSKGLEFVAGSELFADEKIYALLPQKTATYFLITEQQGVYTYNQDTGFVPFPTSSDSLLKSSQVYCGIQLADGNYAIGTRLAGILVFDSNFQFLYKISSKNGLKDDRVANLYEDSNKQLWAALSNGIAYIDVASSFRYFDKNTDINRNILSISPPFNESLYIGTVQGIFKSNTDKAETIKEFNLLPYSERETWKLGVYKNILLGAQNPGIAWLGKKGIEELLAASNPFIQDFALVKNDTSHLIAASIEGLLLLRWQNNHWVFVNKIKGFSGASTKIIQDDNNDFWVSDYNRGIFRFKLSPDFLTVTHSEFFGKLNGLPKNQGNHVFEYDGKAIFGTLEGIYGFSENTFAPHPVFEKLIEKKAITIFEKDTKDNLWIVTQNEQHKFSSSQTLLIQLKKTDSTYQRYDAPFYKIKQIVQAVRPIDENLVLIGTNEGLISYNPLNTIADKQPFSVFITQIEHSSAKDSLLFATDFIINQQNNLADNKNVELPYELNSLRFSFGSSFFEQRSEVYYQTKLEPLNENWSAWTTETQDRFTNLSEGDYVFHLKAQNLYGVESEEVIFKFTIKTPWFRHPLFYLSIVLVLGVLIQYGIKIYTKRLKTEKNLLENTVRERTEDMRQAYFNTRVLSKLGQEITSTRSIHEITDMIYQHVSKLMDASVFAIGIHNEEDETIEFPVAIENGEKLPFHFEALDDTGRFAVWCFINEQDLFINDSEVDYELYMSHRPKTTVGKKAPSLIYLPLKIKKKVIGVITVQSFEKNAYNDYHLNLLRSLAVYTGIAIENANSYHQINEQKDIIEDKNKQLISSINYAKRIQNAILPPLEAIQEEFEESFVLFLPRDIVSGDFYYFNKINGKSIISAIDCTGHGVPGAFMSMIGYELLNEIILAKHITEPARILEALHEGISKGLRQEQTFTQDGMDMTLCIWDEETGILEVAAARNQMYLFNSEDKERILEIEADRQSIGGKMDEGFEFKSHQIRIQKNDTVYLLTDGFQDQFGGVQDRKYLRRRLREFLQNHQHLSMTQQRRALQRELTEWKGDKDQVDDILIIGIRF